MTTTATTSATSENGTQQETLAGARRGDAMLLAHPVAEALLQSRLPARLAYIARDGTPRVVPMLFHWTGEEIVLTCWPDDPKVAALQEHPAVALTIDTTEPPFQVVQIRGTATVSRVACPSPEMAATSERYMGPEAGRGWVEQASRLSPEIARIAVRPTWVDVLDFETRLPGGMERLLTRAATYQQKQQ